MIEVIRRIRARAHAAGTEAALLVNLEEAGFPGDRARFP